MISNHIFIIPFTIHLIKFQMLKTFSVLELGAVTVNENCYSLFFLLF